MGSNAQLSLYFLETYYDSFWKCLLMAYLSNFFEVIYLFLLVLHQPFGIVVYSVKIKKKYLMCCCSRTRESFGFVHWCNWIIYPKRINSTGHVWLVAAQT